MDKKVLKFIQKWERTEKKMEDLRNQIFIEMSEW